MLVQINTMKGEVPRFKSHLLPNEAAQVARNCEFDRGTLAPIYNDLFSHNFSRNNLKTLFKYSDSTWLSWVDEVSVINSPIAQDQYQRIYWTGQGKPKVSAQDIMLGSFSPAAWYDLGVPAPEMAPIILSIDESTGVEPDEAELDAYDNEDRIYLQTYVSRFGEEGSNGPTSKIITVTKPGSTITITLSQLLNDTSNITHTRLYRSVTSYSSQEYMLVAELPIAQTTYVDSAIEINNAVLETEKYTPPDSAMQGLCSMSNGICAGFAGNEVMFSEAYLPYAWPEEYRATTQHEIVAIAAVENVLVVATKGTPHLFSGVTPSSITGVALEVEQSCSNSRSMVVLNGLAIYASPDGLVAVSSSGVQNLTQGLITSSQWQKMSPSTMKAWAVGGLYIAMSNTASFVFDPASSSFIELTQKWDCAFNDSLTNQLYFIDGIGLYAWKAGELKRELTWRSKEFLVPDNSMLSCAKILADSPALVSVKFYVDGAIILTIPKGSLTGSAFRLPPVRGRKLEVEVSGTSDIDRIEIASSFQELS